MKEAHENVILKAILAGICVGIAGIAYLSAANPIIGAVIFSFALLMIVSRKFYLYTGKIGYLFPYKKGYIIVLLKTLLGNLLGIAIVSVLFVLSESDVMSIAERTYLAKIEKTWYQAFALSILCGAVMYIAVDSYDKIDNQLIKTLIVMLGVVIFILAKFEHSIANSLYLILGSVFVPKAFLYIFIMVIGNAIGAIGFAFIDRKANKKIVNIVE